MEKNCVDLIINELPGVVCLLKQNFCAPEVSGLTIQQHRILSLLYIQPKTSTQLSENLAVSLPAISRMISGLAKKSWVEKRASKEDGRNILLHLSKKGQNALETSRKYSYSKLLPKVNDLSTKKKEVLIEAFEILDSIISESAKNK
jgi:DNA-binding MarR family transcriptional regulator